MNLTYVEGTYSRELFINMNEITRISFDNSYSFYYMKEFILDVVEPAHIEAEAKRRFVEEYVEDCTTKKQLYWLCRNTIQKAMKYDPTSRRHTYTY